ncbi:MAG: hypothetical protein N4A49_14310 [Marinifilaceae bacterium]|jgi:transposase-like protein|nr:hypothetical protein [Marinifilaceae bacterium]
MKTKSNLNFIQRIESFSPEEFKLLKEKMEFLIYKKRVSYILETPKNELKCPFCASSKFIAWGRRNDLQRYKCKSCLKTFNSLTNTPLARLRRKGHWLDYAECLKSSLTIREAAAECEINASTSFRWRHRFLQNSKFIKAKKLGGIVEKSFLKLKESFKGSRDKNLVRKKNRKNIYIIYDLDRNNNQYDITNKGFDLKTIDSNFRKLIMKDSLVFINKEEVFVKFAKDKSFKHSYFSKKKDSLASPQKSERYKNIFINWINNKFKGVATRYLENYVSWYRALNEFSSGIKAITLLYRAKSIEKYRHQPLKQTRFL